MNIFVKFQFFAVFVVLIFSTPALKISFAAEQSQLQRLNPFFRKYNKKINMHSDPKLFNVSNMEDEKKISGKRKKKISPRNSIDASGGGMGTPVVPPPPKPSKKNTKDDKGKNWLVSALLDKETEAETEETGWGWLADSVKTIKEEQPDSPEDEDNNPDYDKQENKRSKERPDVNTISGIKLDNTFKPVATSDENTQKQANNERSSYKKTGNIAPIIPVAQKDKAKQMATSRQFSENNQPDTQSTKQNVLPRTSALLSQGLIESVKPELKNNNTDKYSRSKSFDRHALKANNSRKVFSAASRKPFTANKFKSTSDFSSGKLGSVGQSSFSRSPPNKQSTFSLGGGLKNMNHYPKPVPEQKPNKQWHKRQPVKNRFSSGSFGSSF